MKSELNTFTPFHELDNLTGLNRLLKLRDMSENEASLAPSKWMPAVDIIEDEKEFLIKADLPEVGKDEVKVIFDHGMLTISGERHFEQVEEDDKRKYHRIERTFGSFQRSFRLPEIVDAEALTADFSEGVLAVHLPKREDLKPKHIEVKVK
ncbi:MAG: Hsp20/alpha crystallin family protein [Verrucomicrobiales bacterium]|nr:Hsp20/alpha crystallin family protein [Verrucomicrobiales bacterium]